MLNHGPFHHGTEIWYPDKMNQNNTLFRICTDQPINEDSSCRCFILLLLEFFLVMDFPTIERYLIIYFISKKTSIFMARVDVEIIVVFH